MKPSMLSSKTRRNVEKSKDLSLHAACLRDVSKQTPARKNRVDTPIFIKPSVNSQGSNTENTLPTSLIANCISRAVVVVEVRLQQFPARALRLNQKCNIVGVTGQAKFARFKI